MVTAEPTPVRAASVSRAGRTLVGWDVVLSVLALALAGTLVAFGVSSAVGAASYLDRCVLCSPSGALVSVGGPVVVAIAAGFAGLVLTLLRIADRRTSWPFALATLAVCALAIGIERYAASGLLGT